MSSVYILLKQCWEQWSWVAFQVQRCFAIHILQPFSHALEGVLEELGSTCNAQRQLQTATYPSLILELSSEALLFGS
jgi:hypothetical protein